MKSLILLLMAFFVPLSASASYTDVDESLQSTSIDYLQRVGFMTGYADGTFGIGKNVNRAELVKLLVAATKVEIDEEKYVDCFSDVTNEWFAPYVCYAKEQGWINGYSDGVFRPAEPVNMVEAVKMIVEIRGYHTPQLGYFGFSSDARFSEGYTWDDSAWYAPYIASFRQRNIISLEEMYSKSPGHSIQRNTIAEYLYMSLISEGLVSFTFPQSNCGEKYFVTTSLVSGNEFIFGAGIQTLQELYLNAEDSSDFCLHIPQFNPHYRAAIETNGWHLEYFDNVNNEIVDQTHKIPFDGGKLYFVTVDYNGEYPTPLGPDKSLTAHIWEYDLSSNTLRQTTDYRGSPVPRS